MKFNWSLLSFLVFLTLVALLSLKLVLPFIGPIIMAFILYIIFYPVHTWLKNKMGKRKTIASWLMIISILIIFVIPSYYVTIELVNQARSVITYMGSEVDFSGITEIVQGQSIIPIHIDIQTFLVNSLKAVEGFILGNSKLLISSITQVALGSFVMFFVLFYLFNDGPEFLAKVKSIIPLEKQIKNKLINDIETMTHAVVDGQILTAIVQGSIAALGLTWFDVPNSVFWGFVMIILSFLPIVGSPIVWVPAALFKIFVLQDYYNGIGLLIYGFVLVSNIDNIVRPIFMSSDGMVHPVMVVLGVFGGLNLFGFIGLFIGPIILAILMTLINFYYEHYVKKGVSPT